MIEIIIILNSDKVVSNSSACGPVNTCLQFHITRLCSRKTVHANYCCLVISGCGGIVTGTSGVLTSPNFPNNYDHDDHCVWRIDAPVGETITVSWSAREPVYTCTIVYQISNIDFDFFFCLCDCYQFKMKVSEEHVCMGI